MSDESWFGLFDWDRFVYLPSYHPLARSLHITASVSLMVFKCAMWTSAETVLCLCGPVGSDAVFNPSRSDQENVNWFGTQRSRATWIAGSI